MQLQNRCNAQQHNGFVRGTPRGGTRQHQEQQRKQQTQTQLWRPISGSRNHHAVRNGIAVNEFLEREQHRRIGCSQFTKTL